MNEILQQAILVLCIAGTSCIVLALVIALALNVFVR